MGRGRCFDLVLSFCCSFVFGEGVSKRAGAGEYIIVCNGY